jgi:hypothetical protein
MTQGLASVSKLTRVRIRLAYPGAAAGVKLSKAFRSFFSWLALPVSPLASEGLFGQARVGNLPTLQIRTIGLICCWKKSWSTSVYSTGLLKKSLALVLPG